MIDIHNYQKRYENTLNRIKESPEISSKNKKILFGFRDHLLSENIGFAKIERYLYDCIKLNKMLGKTFSDANKEDIRRIVAELNTYRKKDGNPLSENSKKGFKVMLRRFYRFIRGIDEERVYPREVNWISIKIPKNHEKLPEELLSEEEILKIIQKADNTRDKAFLSLLTESGGRIDEIASLRIKDITFEEHGARIIIYKGKTGARKILIVYSSPYLQSWINQHPFNSDSERYLWIKKDGTSLSYARLASILKTSAKRAGIKKRIYCHLTRHSRATILAKNPMMSTPGMNHYMGWIQGGRTAGIYLHLAGKDTDDAILYANGIEVKKDKPKEIMKPVLCLRCKTKNEKTNKFCKLCGFVLDKKEADEIIKQDTERQQADEIMNRLIKDPEILELIKKKLES